ncbi:MAG: bacteriohemerythrin [Candidatus Magnetominusculus sp. LBB02]|nr:bacteriohemerythrin [Candidatus Magnetominusculus sp. LBB02]
MPLITWNESLSVNIEEFDGHHKKIIKLLNGLFDAVAVKKGISVIQPTVAELIDYTRYHFAAEESFLEKHSFPWINSHKHEHDELSSKVLEFQKQLSEGKAMVDLALLNFLKDWLTRHIMGSDKKYSSFIKEKGKS